MKKKFFSLDYNEVSPSSPFAIDFEPEEMILEEEIIEEKKIILKETSVSPLGTIETISTQAPGTVLNAIQYATSSIIATPISISTKYIAKGADFLGDTVISVLDYMGDTISGIGSEIDSSTSLGAALSSIFNIIGTNISSDYSKGEVGISNTTFGNLMSDSWYGTDKSFLNYFSKNKKTYKINILNSTPLDSGNERTSLYGSMMLGVPFLFNSVSDPGNRTLINTLVKDARFLSLTPGLPKYNGGVYTQANSESIYKQTTTPNEMLSFLLKNGLDKNFSLKDKRYYTFESKYDDYFSYLEAMLIPIWIKLGLASEDNKTFNLFSFFDIKKNNSSDTENSINPDGYSSLKSQYKSSIGFFVNASSAVSESMSSQQTSFGGELASRSNSASDTYQKLNYITGMGTSGSFNRNRRTVGIAMTQISQASSYIQENFTKTTSALNSNSTGIGKLIKVVAGIALDTARISATEDFSSLIQSFAVTNGMKTIYPELWSDSSYSKNINFNITFTSPYGDPLSIFKYVYVPFCALLCFALPRQASENGYLSPFFVRADVPGIISSDLGIITDLTWTKGGDANLWTKDGLPRSITCSLTLMDLYPYLAMTKRYSYLSSNPSFTVFLDNMAGLCSLYQNESDDPLNDYWNQLINRISGENNGLINSRLYNRYSKDKQKIFKEVGNTKKGSLSSKSKGGIDYNSIPWFSNET